MKTVEDRKVGNRRKIRARGSTLKPLEKRGKSLRSPEEQQKEGRRRYANTRKHESDARRRSLALNGATMISEPTTDTYLRLCVTTVLITAVGKHVQLYPA